MSGKIVWTLMPAALLLAGCVHGRTPAAETKPAAPVAKTTEAGAVRDASADRLAILRYAQGRMAESVAAYERGELDTAIRGFREVVSARPFDLQGHLFLAKAYRAHGSADGAVAALQQVLRLEGSNRDARVGLAALHVEGGRYVQALALLEPIRAALEDEPAALAVLGEALVGSGRDEEAQVWFKRALELDPASEAAWRGVVAYHALAGNRHRAEQLVRDMGRAGVAVARVLAAVGDDCWKKGMTERALAFYDQVGDVAPDSVLAYERMATACAQLGRQNEAVEYARAGMVYHPQDPSLRYALGAAHAAAGRHPVAILHFRKLLQDYPDHAAGRLALAREYRAAGDTAASVTELTRALARNGADPVLHQELALTYRAAGEEELAVVELKAARDLDPEGRFVLATPER